MLVYTVFQLIVTIYWVKMTHMMFKLDRDDILGLIVTIYWITDGKMHDKDEIMGIYCSYIRYFS